MKACGKWSLQSADQRSSFPAYTSIDRKQKGVNIFIEGNHRHAGSKAP